MHSYTATAKTVEQYADDFRSPQGSLLFQSRELRDSVARLLKDRGVKHTKRVSKGQKIHPEYVADYVGHVETGFGNTMYRTYFANLYAIEAPYGD